MTRAILVALMTLVAAPAFAQNASTAGALELYPNLNALSARLAWSGDANGNATARLEWRLQGATAWTAGLTMTRITGQRFAASVLWLQPDVPYEVRAVIDDPDGGGSATGSVRTRKMPNLTPSGATYWVAGNGNDAASGGSSAPLATLQAAAVKAQPGDQIRVRPGVYYQALDAVRAGTASALIHLVADGPGVILDGSDPAYLSRSDWRNDGNGIHSQPFTAAARLVQADSLQRLYHHASLAALQSNANGVSQGWVIEGGRLYVKLEDGSSPNGHVMHIARYNTGIVVDVPYWRISGFEVRHFGNVAGGFGIYLRSASGCVVTDNTIHGIGGKLMSMRVGTGDCILERNLLFDGRISTWPWAAVKAHEEEDAGISNRGGRGNVIRYNTIRGVFNGIDCADGTTDENVAADCDIHDNAISKIGDDAIETDEMSGLNVRIYRNRVDDVYNVLSIAPSYQGPEYVLYNTFTNFSRSAFKYSYASTGQTYLYHNTIVGTAGGAQAIWPTGQYSNQHFRNNVFVMSGGGLVSGDDGGESQTGNDFDYDLLTSTGPTLFRWKGVNYANLSALRSGTGFEASGRSLDPLFASLIGGDFSLRTGSPAIDAALRIAGVNDGFSGTAPDLGAVEVGGVDATRPAPIKDLH